MSKKKDLTLYYRSFLMTLGFSFIIFTVWLLFVNYQSQELITLLFITLISLFLVLGTILIYLGLYASDKKVEQWADAASKEIVVVIIMLIAYPLYKILKHKRWLTK